MYRTWFDPKAGINMQKGCVVVFIIEISNRINYLKQDYISPEAPATN